MGMSLPEVVSDFAIAFKAVDVSAPVGASSSRTYRPGIGPLKEADAIKLALVYLQAHKSGQYSKAAPAGYPGKQDRCDLLIPGEWALEFKLIRPFGDNGVEAPERWVPDLLYPYKGNVSAIGDALKLSNSTFTESKGVLIFGYEHTLPRLDITVAVRAFEWIASQLVGIQLGPRQSAKFSDLIHPVHQQGWVFGWKVL